MPFIRVKSSLTGHEFDVAPHRVEDHPDWSVVDAEPVDVAREPKYGKPAKVKAKPAEPAPEVEADPEPVSFPRFSQNSAPETD